MDPAIISVIVAAFIGAITVTIAIVSVRWQRSDRWERIQWSRQSELEARVSAAEERERMKDLIIDQLRSENIELLRRLAKVGNNGSPRPANGP